MNKKNIKLHLALSSFLLIFVIAAVFFSLKILNNYTSKIFVLNKTILNIKNEFSNENKIKSELENYSFAIESINSHIITKEDDVPKIIENIEGVGGKLGLDVKIDNISIPVSQANKAGAAASPNDIENSKKTATGEVATSIPKNLAKPILIDLTTTGDFEKLFKFMYLLENDEYIMNIQSYKLEQVYISSSTTGQTYSPIGQIPDKTRSATWFLNIKLVINTAIK